MLSNSSSHARLPPPSCVWLRLTTTPCSEQEKHLVSQKCLLTTMFTYMINNLMQGKTTVHIFVTQLSQIEPLAGLLEMNPSYSHVHFLYHITQLVRFYKPRYRT